MSDPTTPTADHVLFDFVYKRDDFTVPMQAVWNSLSPLHQECLAAYLAAREQEAERQGRISENVLCRSDLSLGKLTYERLEKRYKRYSQPKKEDK